jgi:hypothetical protein
MTAHQLHVSYRRNVTRQLRRQRPTLEVGAGVKVTIVDLANVIATALDAGTILTLRIATEDRQETVVGLSVWGDRSATGAKVAFNNYVATGGLRFGRADIESVNLAVSTTPTRVVSQRGPRPEPGTGSDDLLVDSDAGPPCRNYVTPIP